MTKVTIHTYGGRKWEGAYVVGSGLDVLMNAHRVLTVRHPHFKGDIDFFAEPDNEGRHFNVGNWAFWMTMEGGYS